MAFAVHHPGSVADAVALASRLGDSARFIAGGTDLVVQINHKRCAPHHLIDITRLGELAGIEETQCGVRIGALTTHKEIERHPAFQGALRGLVEAACVVGVIRCATSARSAATSPIHRRQPMSWWRCWLWGLTYHWLGAAARAS